MAKRVMTQDHKDKIAAALSGRKLSIETRIKISEKTKEAMKKIMQDPVKRQNIARKGEARNGGEANPYWKGGKKSYCHDKAKMYFGLMGVGLKAVSKYGDVHHLDRDITNNSPENLMLLSKSDHTKLHHLENYGD